MFACIEIVLGSWGCNVLDDALLARMPKLRFLAYAAGTVKHTVTPATWDRGVVVSSAAAANAVPVAEFTFAAIVMIGKDVFRHATLARRRARAVTVVGPAGELGTVVCASADRRVDDRPARGRHACATLDVAVAVADPYLDDADARTLGATRWSSTSSSPGPTSSRCTRRSCRRRVTSSTPTPGSHARRRLVVNTARGSLVDTDALTRDASPAAQRLHRHPRSEPLPSDSPLYDLPNVVLTPHIAGSFGTELSRMGDLAVAEIGRFVAGDASSTRCAPTTSKYRVMTTLDAWAVHGRHPSLTKADVQRAVVDLVEPVVAHLSPGGARARSARSARTSPRVAELEGTPPAVGIVPLVAGGGRSTIGTAGSTASPTAPIPRAPSTGGRAPTTSISAWSRWPRSGSRSCSRPNTSGIR